MRLIDADKLEELWAGISPGATVHPDSVIDTIKRAKTINDNNHMHAHWIWRFFLQKVFYECSKCGKYSTSRTNYCGSCGAKMDEVENDG